MTLRDEESGWSERPLSWYSVQLSSFPNGRSAYVTSCRWFPDAVCCRRCSESAEECLLCVHGRLWTPHNVHSPWQIYGGAEFLAHGWNSLHRPSSAIVFALQLLRRMFKNTYREDLVHCSLPGTEVKCQPVDKLCKNVSRGKLTKTSILWTVRRIRLHWSINIVPAVPVHRWYTALCTALCTYTSWQDAKAWNTPRGDGSTSPCWEPMSSCRLCSCKLIMMILNDEAVLNNDSQLKPLNTAPRSRTNRPFASWETRRGWFGVVLWRINLNK